MIHNAQVGEKVVVREGRYPIYYEQKDGDGKVMAYWPPDCTYGEIKSIEILGSRKVIYVHGRARGARGSVPFYPKDLRRVSRL